MFDILKGGSANLDLTVDRPEQPYWTGERVHATLRVESKEDLKLREGRVTLISQEKYLHSGKVGTKWMTDERELDRKVLLGESTIRAGISATHEFDLQIPDDAAPTVKHAELFRVSWLVRATLERHLMPDVQQTIEIPVSTKPPGKALPDELGCSNEPDEAEINFSVPGMEWVPGESIAGTLLISPRKQFDVKGIRVELVRDEQVSAVLLTSMVDNEAREAIKVELSGKTKLMQGASLSFPFRLDIPADAAPTIRTPHGSIRWSLNVVLDRPFRSDMRCEREVFIYSGRRPPDPA